MCYLEKKYILKKKLKKKKKKSKIPVIENLSTGTLSIKMQTFESHATAGVWEARIWHHIVVHHIHRARNTQQLLGQFL